MISLSPQIREQLQSLRAAEWFRLCFTELIKNRPTIRAYTPSDDNSVELLKADSMRREGYDLCLLNLGYKQTDLKGDD